MPRPEAPDPVETTHDSLNVLAAYRRRGERKSEDVVKRGEKILQERGALRRMGDEGERANELLSRPELYCPSLGVY